MTGIRGGDVGGVARPHLRAHRPAIAVDHHRQDHLTKIGPMILAVAVTAQRLAAGAFEVEAGGVHEHQVEAGEQVAAMGEQSLLHHILAASRRQRRAAVLIFRRQFLTQPRHGAIEVMKIEPVDAGDPIILAPAVRRAIGAADEQPVQHGEEHRPLQCKAVLTRPGEIFDHRPAAGLLPQPFEHQRRSDASAGDLCRGIVGDGREHHRLGREPRARSQQPLELAAGLKLLVTSKGGDHLLANLVAIASALDDLQIGAAG